MLSHEKNLIVIILILLVLTEGLIYKNWYYKIKRSKSSAKKDNWKVLVTIQEDHPTNSCEFYAGTLLRKNWVLTSAMVFQHSTPKERFIVQSDCIRLVGKGGSKFYVHPEFHYRQFFMCGIAFNDIALLQLIEGPKYCQVSYIVL